MTLALSYCIVHTHGIVDALDKIQIEPTQELVDLCRLVYTDHEIFFKEINADRANLELYAPPGLKKAPAADRSQRVDSSILALNPLDLFDEVRVAFKENELDSSLIHLVVAARPSAVPAKRSHPSADDDLCKLKRSKIAITKPSTFAKSREYKDNQRNSSERFLDDRPNPDRDVAPVALLYDGFGTFLDIFRGRKNVPEVQPKQIEVKVDAFANKMAEFYYSEDKRREVGLAALSEIFAAHTGNEALTISAASIGSVRTDGHANGRHGGASMVYEFKNEPCDNSAIPVAELTGYVAHSHKNAIDVDSQREELYRRWRVPCLGLTIVGPYVTFYAIIFVRRYRVVSLTPTLSCIQSAGDGDDRRALYAAFTAASVLIARIQEDAAKFVEEPPENPHSDRFFPCISQLPKYGSASDVLDFRIIRFYADRQDYRLLYIAETINGNKEIIVKFTRRYSIELHKFCADRGHAPEILGFGELPGGWFAVAMKYISSATSLSNASKRADCRDEWIRELKDLVKSFHGEGLVHGDLRDPNIICNGEKVMLIDFDWSGKDGEVSYPTYNLNPELAEGRTGNDLKITKDDDNRVLRKTLGKI